MVGCSEKEAGWLKKRSEMIKVTFKALTLTHQSDVSGLQCLFLFPVYCVLKIRGTKRRRKQKRRNFSPNITQNGEGEWEQKSPTRPSHGSIIR